MKISARQALIMYDVLKASVNIMGGWGGYSQDTLLKVLNEIVNQQDIQVTELPPDDSPEEASA